MASDRSVRGRRRGNIATVGLIGWGILGLATPLTALAIAWPVGSWAAWGRRNMGRLAFAALAGLLALALGRLTLDLWRPLNRATFWLAAGLLRLISPEIVCRREDWEIGTPRFSVIIESACSGYEGIGLIVALIGAYLLAPPRRPPGCTRAPRVLRFPISRHRLVDRGVANAVRIVLSMIAPGSLREVPHDRDPSLSSFRLHRNG